MSGSKSTDEMIKALNEIASRGPQPSDAEQIAEAAKKLEQMQIKIDEAAKKN